MRSTASRSSAKVNPEVWPAYARRFARQFGFKPQE